MKKFYSLEEIRDAMVVDSEGLIYGYVRDLQIIDNSVRLSVYTVSRVNDLIVDVEKLISMLSKRANLTGSEPLETLVSIARREGLDIPYKVSEKDVEWLKGFVAVDEIQLIDVKKVSVDEMDSIVKVVLLSTPREASFRGLPIQKTVPMYRVEQILNKLVVSLSKGIIGVCKEVVIAPKTIGFRVYSARGVRRVINWIAFTAQIKRLGFRDIYEKLVEFRDPYRFSKVDLSIAKDIENILESYREKDKVMNIMQNFVEVETTAREFEDIAYNDIVKVGDIVIVS